MGVRITAVLRWLAVLPVAVAVIFPATFVANLLAILFQGLSEDGGGLLGGLIRALPLVAIQRSFQNVLGAFASIWFGARVAPSFRLHVAAVLFALELLFLGAAAMAGVSFSLQPGRASALEILVAMVFGVIGSIWAVYEVYAHERKGYASGPRGWLP